MKNKLAVVILAYADYESLEITLANHSKHLPLYCCGERVKIYILQNGRGTYDCERTLMVGKRYQDLYPRDIQVIDWIKPDRAYYALKKLFHEKLFSDTELIVKLDDDVFPLTSSWLSDLYNAYTHAKVLHGENLAYVTSLVNNNPWGFAKTLEIMNLKEEYESIYAREHLVGSSKHDPFTAWKIVPKGEIFTGGNGTIWRYPYLARWIHRKTTLAPDIYIKATENLGLADVPAKQRYSINCMLFEKRLWDDIDIGHFDDEHMLQRYCIKHDKRIVANLAVPMVHLFFFTQRFENRDLIEEIRAYYQQWLGCIYPISLCSDRILEIEARLKFLENAQICRTTKKSNVLERMKECFKMKVPQNSYLYKLAAKLYHYLV